MADTVSSTTRAGHPAGTPEASSTSTAAAPRAQASATWSWPSARSVRTATKRSPASTRRESMQNRAYRPVRAGPTTTSPGTAAWRSSRRIIPDRASPSSGPDGADRHGPSLGPLEAGIHDALEHGPRRQRVAVGEPLRVEDRGLGQPAQRVDLQQVDDICLLVPEQVQARIALD